MAGQRLAKRLTARTVEVFLKGERIAAHRRSSGNHKHTTIPEHMPSSHRRYAGWTIERIRDELALPILYVSHDRAEVARLANNVVEMD